MRSGDMRVRSWPANSMAPFRGGKSPEMARRVVVLPAPLPPIKVTTSPGAHVEGDALEHRQTAIPGLDAF